MKHTKKLIVAVIAVVAAFALCVPALAFAADDGSITVENATYGKEYKAYKIFNATYTGDAVNYSVDSDKETVVGESGLFDIGPAVDSNGKKLVTLKDGKTISDITTWLQGEGVLTNFPLTKKGVFNDAHNSVTFTEIPYGYYYITSTLGTVVTVDTAKPNATVKDKNASAPTDPVKTIVSVDGTAAADLKAADAHVGSVIGFKVTGNATNYTTSGTGTSVTTEQNTTYTFEDTPVNMTIDAESIAVKVNGNPITSNYSASVGTDGKLTVTINLTSDGTTDGTVLYQALGENSAYIPIEVTYNATIDAAAADAAATNTIGEDVVTVLTYKFQIEKVDEKGDPLPGAQFELWANGAALTFIANSDGSYTYSPTGTVTTLDMTTNTTVMVKGLDKKWQYTLKETKVPNGYTQAADKPVAGSGLSPATATSNITTVTVENVKGSVLPSTGGMGTTILYIVGGIMIVVAAVFLVGRRRSSKNNDSDDQM